MAIVRIEYVVMLLYPPLRAVVASVNADERFAPWVEWGDRLVKEIGDAHVERTIWREMTDALDAQLPDSKADSRPEPAD